MFCLHLFKGDNNKKSIEGKWGEHLIMWMFSIQKDPPMEVVSIWWENAILHWNKDSFPNYMQYLKVYLFDIIIDKNVKG